jgi:replication factor C subunit 3/5
MQDNNIPWIEKYRPSKLENIKSQDFIKTSLQKLVEQNTIPHLLFFGSSGTGKTSSILACIKELEEKGYIVSKLELNTSDQRGIKTVRKKIKEFATTQSFFKNGLKIIILDEADYMTNIAQCALRQIIEKYSKNVRFCIICNYINKIIPAIQSRCMKFRFSLLTDEEMKNKIEYIVKQEKLKISDKAIATIISLSGGDMRKSINILQTIPIFCKNKVIDDNDIRICLGYPTENIITNTYDILSNKNKKIKSKYNLINDIIKNDGILLCNLLQCLHKIVLKNKKNFTPKKLIYILKTFALIEQHLTQNVNENIQLGILISSFS